MINILRKFGKKASYVPPFCTAIIPASGTATRMEGMDKIFLELDGVPVIVRAMLALEQCDLIHEIIVATRDDLIVPLGKFCAEYQITKSTKIVRGGETRSHSVLAGLREVGEQTQLIAIHDGARPFPTSSLLEEVLTKGAETGAAAPAIPVVDTIKRGNGRIVEETLDRSTLWAVQTPQVFQAGLIKAALEEGIDQNVSMTDDCSAVERLGMKVSLTRGDRQNIKITTPLDVYVAQGILSYREEMS